MAQIVAAISMAIASVPPAAAHLLSTTTFDLLVPAAPLVARRTSCTGDDRLWLVIGVVVGVGLFNSTLVAFRWQRSWSGSW